MKFSEKYDAFYDAFNNAYDLKKWKVFSRSEIVEIQEEIGLPYPTWIVNPENCESRGLYYFPPRNAIPPVKIKGKRKAAKPAAKKAAKPAAVKVLNAEPKEVVAAVENAVRVGVEDIPLNLVPKKDPLFVPYGNATPLKRIMKSEMFFPVLITGLSGNGKTYMSRQIAAGLKRDLVRVNLTTETDEDDLIGGFRLIDGDTRFFKGPVIRAMEAGAVLLLDEIDLANPAKIMCLQSIMEGSDYLIKKTGERVFPEPGFTIIATANTKGQGSDDGRFVGTNVLNEAFLERFPVTLEQEYPTRSVENKILTKLNSVSLKIEDAIASEFIDKLTNWADVVRKAYAAGGCDEVISTRRLVHIMKAFNIFGDKMKAIQYCVNRFDDEVKTSFIDLYTKIDAGVSVEDLEKTVGNPQSDEEEKPVW